jgi:hypothetical protein
MAYITIETDTDGGLRTLHESLSCNDLDNQVFSDHLVERLRWAVEDTVTPASGTRDGGRRDTDKRRS